MMLGQLVQAAILIVLLCVPIVVSIGVRRWFQGGKAFVVACVISVTLMSGAEVVQWLGYHWYLERQITPLDRDGDGVWSPVEVASWTKAEKSYMDAYLGDGGRNVFAMMLFPAFSVVYSLVVITLSWLIVSARRQRRYPMR